jgi:hypothetical protein
MSGLKENSLINFFCFFFCLAFLILHQLQKNLLHNTHELRSNYKLQPVYINFIVLDEV